MEEMGRVMTGRARRRRIALLFAGIGLVALVAVPYLTARTADPPPAPPPPAPTENPATVARATARQFLTAWAREDWDKLQSLTADQSLDAAGVHRSTHETLRITGAKFSAAAATVEDDTATVPYRGTWELEGLDPYTYNGEIRLVREGGEWAVRWWYPTVHPDMTPTTRLERTRVFPNRAPILAADGRRLATSREVVVVGIQPGRVSDPDEVLSALTRMTTADPARVRRLLARDDAEDVGFYRVTRMRPARFNAVRPQLFPIEGLVFRREQHRTLHTGVAPSLIGRMGEITAEQLETLGPSYSAGDRVGQTGLEAAFQQQLTGAPSYEAAITDDLGLVRSLGYSAGSPPRPVRTTLDVRMQYLAEYVLQRSPSPAAMVVLDPETAGVRAAAFTPPNGINRALSGVYPPGSTFKVVTAAAALYDGVQPRSRLNCPARIRIGNRPIQNAGAAGYGRVTFRESFAKSCNTTFARMGLRVGPAQLTRVAERFGFNSDLNFALPAAGGSFPTPQSEPELARAAIGQARIQVSPLLMASVAAAVRTGTYRPPTLLPDDVQDAGQPVGRAVRRQLHDMMREVVRSGTGTRAQLPTTPVAGKTGSAEFGSGDETHAWFIGYTDEVAFAVVVERGGGGGSVAAPVARDFLDRLQNQGPAD